MQTALTALHIITDGSLWIDEFGTARIAEATTFARWWQQFVNWPNSDIQMPFYHGFMFVWTKWFGFSEYALRMANWPLFILAEAALLWTFRRVPRFALVLILLSTFHPLIWYYLNEARPYIMVYLGATLTLCALVSLYADMHQAQGIQPYSPWLLTNGLLLLAGSSMLGAPWVVAAILLALYFYRSDVEAGFRMLMAGRLAYSALGLGLLLLACFYIYTLFRGARATSAFESNISTLLFSGYELLGLPGLGPGRLELRADGVAALEGWTSMIISGTIILATCFFFGLRQLCGIIGARQLGAISLGVILPGIFIAVVGFSMHWRVLGRHFMPFLPIVLALLALGATSLLAGGRIWERALASLLIVTLAVSGISMGLPRHAKDDYRSAADLALQALASGNTVWWAAIGSGADYYQVPLRGTAARPGENCRSFDGPAEPFAYHVANQRAHCLESLPTPDLIVLSKPNTFDRRGSLTQWIAASEFEQTAELPAFTVWRAITTSSQKH